MAAEYELTLADYLSIMRRRAPYLAGIFAVVLLATIIVAFAIPPTYRSTGTIMVESPQVPENIVPTAGKSQLDERIDMIKQRVLTRDSLLRIANKYNLFKERALFLTSTELIERMRERVGLELIFSNEAQGNRQVKSTIAFNLSFDDKSPEIARQVASDLVNLFLNWNVKLRTEGATGTAIFLTQESEKLKLEVERQEGLISAYKQQNTSSLPEQLSLRMAMLTRDQTDLHEVERDYMSAKEELRSLQAELAAAKYGVGGDPSQSLPELKATLTKLSATYSESHPDIKILKRKIEAMEKAADSPASETEADKTPTSATYKIKTKIDAINAKLESLARQQKTLQEKIDQNERAIALTPKVGQGLDALIRDRDNAQKKYDEIINKKMSAQIAESLESESKSEHFTLLEPPILPEKPFKPDRVKIIALGFFLAIASAGGMLMAMVTFDGQIRGVDALSHVLGHRPIAVIPYLVIQEEEARRKRIIKMTLIVSILVAVIIAVALHFLYMPLTDLLRMVLARLV